MTEIWKPIPMLCESYEASSTGKIRRLKSSRGSTPGRVKVERYLPKGYKVVSISIENKPQTRLVHRLIANAFIGDCPAGKQVNHKDGNRENNTPENLEYVTQSENNFHAVERIGAYRGDRRKDCAVTPEIVRKIREAHNSGMGYVKISKAIPISWGIVRNVLKGKTWGWVK
jgi:hypothetical protein